jgi:PAS domain S-box-containing protein
MADNQDNCIINSKEIHRLLEHVSDSIIIIDPMDIHIVYFNNSAYESLGYSKEEFKKIGNQFFIARHNIDTIKYTIEQVLAGHNQSFVSEHIAKDGSIQYAEVKLSTIEINQESFICGIWKDITIDVENEKIANTKTERLKRFLEVLALLNNSEEFSNTDVKKYAKRVAPLISDSLDIDRVSIRLYDQDKSLLDSISLFDRNNLDRLVAKTLTRIEYPVFFDYIESNETLMIENIKKNTTMQDTIKVFFSEDGMINSLLGIKIRVHHEVVGYIFLQSKAETIWDREYVLFASQISDQIGIMLLNKELKKHQQLLEITVEKRTKELQIAKDIAEKATISKTKFLSNVSHEIRTPLNAVIGFLSLIDSQKLDEKNRMYIDQIKIGSDNLLDIINDVLDIAKMESGKMNAHIELVDLQKFYVKKTNFYVEFFRNNGIQFEFKFNCESNQFYTDINLLNIITNNLLSNALKYTKEGKVRLEFVEKVLNQEESELSILVEDTGIGIKEQDFAKIFLTFEQIEQSGYKENKGTGLGLALTKQIVELLNGSIHFKSTYAVGTTFSVVLPMKYLRDGEKPLLAKENENDHYHYRFPKKRVLVVDDHTLNLSMLQSFIENTGLVLDTACNGLSALKKIESNHYDLIFMDLQMPLLDGLKTCQLIRLNPKYSNLPIIALTATAYQNDEDKIKYSIFDDYIIKPVHKEIVIKACDYYLVQNQPVAQREINQNTFLEIIDEFAQISVKDGLYYVSDDIKLYQTILLEFLASHSQDFNSLLSYIEDNDMDASYRIVHTLKSLLKTIGMNGIYQNVVTIEKLIIEKNNKNRYIDDIRLAKEAFERNVYVLNYVHAIFNEKQGVPNEV